MIWPFRSRDDKLLIDDLRRAVMSLQKMVADQREQNKKLMLNIVVLEKQAEDLRRNLWAIVKWSDRPAITVPEEELTAPIPPDAIMYKDEVRRFRIFEVRKRAIK